MIGITDIYLYCDVMCRVMLGQRAFLLSKVSKVA